MLRGWARDVINSKSSIKHPTVNYRAPCRRRLRNMDEVHRYLRLTGSHLGVDLFSFDSRVQGFKQFQPSIICAYINGNLSLCLFFFVFFKNNFCLQLLCFFRYYEWKRKRVSCVNSIERSAPPFVDYTTKRIPRKGVEINTEETFLVCCDCTDDCQDKGKCQCWQQTIQVWFQI